ncbi:unnamed protein product [Vicia faba]|uniref:Reverse transcriptase zinc-binding domain-containing protein n=1 Tax=Vicia faba TaxID=3906 RepID=A0AAV1AA08_VICFA|nr:unnamed protein product [Vicia faba]
MIMDGLGSNCTEDKELVSTWSKLVPLKVSVLAWRLWQNRIPTKDSLIKRGILEESQSFCPYFCGKEESEEHIFFECLIALVTWSEIIRWLNFSYVSHNSAMWSFLHFAGLCSGDIVMKERFSVIWFGYIWTMWRRGNEENFKSSEGHTEGNSVSYLEDIQLTSWKWLKSKVIGFNHALIQWNLNPKECLGWRS